MEEEKKNEFRGTVLRYAYVLKELGNTQRDLGKFSKAHDMFKKAQNIFLKFCTVQSLDYIGTLKRLARIYFDTKQYQKSN